MKVICVGRNYAQHARELNNPIPERPILFMKPHSAILRNNQPFSLPAFSKQVEYEVEVVLRIGRNGKDIAEQDALKYINGVGIGIDFTARDLQQQLKEKGHPWEIAKAFDHSAPVSDFLNRDSLPDLGQLDFSLVRNGETVQTGNTADMLFSIPRLIAYASKFFTLNIGDLLFTGTPAGVGTVASGDKLEAWLNHQKLLTCDIK
jgi:2-keto-4-pentenoate hydratase/2-oxohepta-3-ene-1,7-dioic acid hydratase in catechol pathway